MEGRASRAWLKDSHPARETLWSEYRPTVGRPLKGPFQEKV